MLPFFYIKMNVVFFTGAGISAESGIKTFRDHDGLWEGHDLMEVAHIDAWNRPTEQLKQRQLILEFYNQRRRQLKDVQPNAAHLLIADFEKRFPNTHVITQNVDDLHERAGSKNIIHLHGELLKAESEKDKNLVVPWTEDLNLGDLAKDGHQLRPHIVWFGEHLPQYEIAAKVIREADVIISIGTSGVVEPAASLFFEKNNQIKMIVNPFIDQHLKKKAYNYYLFEEQASTGVEKAIKQLENLDIS